MNEQAKKYTVIGVMSGTSLDGLDIVAVDFIYSNDRWKYSIVAAETLAYHDHWAAQLKNAPGITAAELAYLDMEYGKFIGESILVFVSEYKLNPDLIASHGHTIFHQPEKGISYQAGNGAAIAAASGITTVNNFRILDVSLGGQGAPLVPVGDKCLFPEYDYCLNLGGFSNISYSENDQRLAFDICPVNIILNSLCPPYDKNGEKGRQGEIDKVLLSRLNALSYYRKAAPKSLGREWLENTFLPEIEPSAASPQTKLRTLYEHIATQISVIVNTPDKKVLVTGGGAKNSFLMELLKEKCAAELVIPHEEIIDFKEALIFAFLGLLRMRGEKNVYASVTGARKDSCSGQVFRL